MKLNRSSRHSLVVVSIATWLAACAETALRFGKAGESPASGASLMGTGLFWGWSVLNFAAYANPLLLVGWIQCWRGKFRSARILSILSMILACQTLQLILHPCTLAMPGDNYPWSDVSDCGYRAKPALGLFLWVGSMVIVLLATFVSKDSESDPKPADLSILQTAPDFDENP